MSNITYKQIATYFSQIAYNHEQINSFGFGDFKQLTMDVETKQEPKYTRMYVVPGDVEFNTNHIHFNYNVLIIDKLEEDQSNMEEVLSDTLEICMDVWTVFWQSYTNQSGGFSNIIVGDWGPNVVPFVEQYETTLAGWNMGIRMSIPFDYNDCTVPIRKDLGITWDQVKELWKNENDKWSSVTAFILSTELYPSNIFPQDESYSSYYQVVQDWRRFCDLHAQVNSFGFGPGEQLTVDRYTKQEPLYPRMYFIPDTARLDENHMHITWDVTVTDKIFNDYSNQVEVLSDCLEICKDFFSVGYLSDYDLEWDVILNPWLEDTETTLAGWSMKISIQQKYDYNRCVLPIRSMAEGITWDELNELWKKVAEQWDEIRKNN